MSTEEHQRKIKGSIYKPPTDRPDETNISLGEYIDDAKVRWQIHLFEWDEFTKDVIVPLAKTSYDWTVKTFNNLRQMQKDSVTANKQSTERVGGDLDKL